MNHSERTEDKKATIIIMSRYIYPGNNMPMVDGAVIINNDRIEALVQREEADQWVGEETQVIQWDNQLVMPSFIDPHVHLTFGSLSIDERFSLQLSHCKSEAECVEAVREFGKKAVAKTPPNTVAKEEQRDSETSWIFGFGWNYLTWQSDTLPTYKSLDNLDSNYAVCLISDDFHSVWLNRKGMELCQIEDRREGCGPLAVQFPNGDLTGVLLDHEALSTISQAIGLANLNIKGLYQHFFDYALKHGVTTIGDVAPSGVDNAYKILSELEQENALLLRIKFYMETIKNTKQLNLLRSEYHSNRLRFGGFKAFVDGVISVHTAHLIEPYSDRPDQDGGNCPDYENIEEQVMYAYEHGLPIRCHVIGDGAVRRTLDIFENAQSTFGKSKVHHTLEHLELIHPNDILRLKELDIIASMQPLHGTDDIPGFTGKVGKERTVNAWPFQSILKEQVNLAFGTDFPIVELNPMATIYAAVSRKNKAGYPKDGWNPSEKVTVRQAIDAYTIGAARALSIENDIGSLEDGKLADLVVLNHNLLSLDTDDSLEPEVILTTAVEMTMCNGKIVYRRS
jgi:predicted amidohydrolase YtcJ